MMNKGLFWIVLVLLTTGCIERTCEVDSDIVNRWTLVSFQGVEYQPGAVVWVFYSDCEMKVSRVDSVDSPFISKGRHSYDIGPGWLKIGGTKYDLGIGSKILEVSKGSALADFDPY